MGKLVLIRHSLADAIPGRPADAWVLSERGREKCSALAALLEPFTFQCIASSDEPKALETARLVGERLGVSVTAKDGLHEHRRRTVALVAQEEFEATVEAMFLRPDERVFGEETATEARERFGAAVDALVEESSSDLDLAVVTHGTVMALYVARWTGIDAVSFWRRLDRPSFAVLSLPERELLRVVEQV